MIEILVSSWAWFKISYHKLVLVYCGIILKEKLYVSWTNIDVRCTNFLHLTITFLTFLLPLKESMWEVLICSWDFSTLIFEVNNNKIQTSISSFSQIIYFIWIPCISNISVLTFNFRCVLWWRYNISWKWIGMNLFFFFIYISCI